MVRAKITTRKKRSTRRSECNSPPRVSGGNMWRCIHMKVMTARMPSATTMIREKRSDLSAAARACWTKAISAFVFSELGCWDSGLMLVSFRELGVYEGLRLHSGDVTWRYRQECREQLRFLRVKDRAGSAEGGQLGWRARPGREETGKRRRVARQGWDWK